MATVRIQVRRGTASQWTSANPTLAAGELGVESDTNLFKFGNGSTAWTSLAYANNSDVAIGEISQDAINTALTMGAGLTKTYNDGANTITITVDSTVVALKTYVDSAVSTHEADTTNVHGIADTAALATKAYADSAVSTHEADTTSVHGITNSASLVYLTDAQTLTGKTLTNVVLDGTPTAPTQTANDNSTKIATTAYVQTELADLIGTAPALLDTLGELSDALNDNENYAAAMTSTITGINNTIATKLATADFTSHAIDTTDVHGITNTANLVYTSDARLSDTRTPTAGSVTLGSIAANSIGTTSLLDSSVTTAKIAAVSVTEAKLADDSVTAAKIAAGAVGTSEIADLSVTSAKIASDAVGSSHIAAGAVGTSEIADLSVTSAKIASDAVGSSHIAAAAVGTSELENDSVTAAKIADSAVGTSEINALAVTEAKIADLNVTTAKINDSAVTEGKIAALSVTTGKIADLAVTSGKIADGTIVDADVNASAAIAQSKISGLTADLALKAPIASPTFTGTVTLPAGTVTSGMILDGTIVDADVNASAAIAQSKISGLTADLALKAPIASPTFTGTVTTGTVTTGHVLPSTDITFDLGSPTKMWRDIYVGPGSLYVNGQKVLQTDAGDVVITADANENLALRTSGSGNIELDPTGAGSVNIKGPLVVEAGANFSSNDGNGIAFSNGLKSDTLVSKTLNTDLSLSGNGTGKVYLNDNAEVNGNLVVGGSLTVSGTTTTVNSETISLADNIIDLNSNFTTGTPTENAGIKIKRGDSSDVQIRWNESTDKWEFTTDGTNYSVIAPTASPTFTGTVTLPAGTVTSGMILDGTIVDADVNASAAIAQSKISGLTADLALKAPIASPTFTGTVTVAASGVAFTDGTQTKAGVPSLTTIGTTISGAYNLSTGGLSLRDQLIPVSGTQAITVPLNATTAFPIGTSIDFYQSSGTGANFVFVSGVTPLATPGQTLRTTYSSATLTKVATDTWLLAGDLKV